MVDSDTIWFVSNYSTDYDKDPCCDNQNNMEIRPNRNTVNDKNQFPVVARHLKFKQGILHCISMLIWCKRVQKKWYTSELLKTTALIFFEITDSHIFIYLMEARNKNYKQ